MSSEFEKGRDLLQSKIWKLRREIDAECKVFLQKKLDDNKPYQYYSSQIDALTKKKDKSIESANAVIDAKIAKKENDLEIFRNKIQAEIDAVKEKKERELEIFRNKIQAEIDALESNKETKKQIVDDSIQASIDGFLKKCTDIEKNLNRPSSDTFLKKEEMLEMLEIQLVEKNHLINAEFDRKTKQMREEAQARVRAEIRQQEIKDAEAREIDMANRKRAQEDEDKRQDEREKKQCLPPSAWIHASYGMPEPVKYIKPVRESLNGRDISKMCKEEIDLLDTKTLTAEEEDAVCDRIEYLDNNPKQSKELDAEYFAYKKKQRKEEKKVT
jgi:hypothetical protein